MISYDHFEVWLHHKIWPKKRNALEMSNLFFDWQNFRNLKFQKFKCLGFNLIPRNEKRNSKDRHILQLMVFSVQPK
jgi:TnpA family transposase